MGQAVTRLIPDDAERTQSSRERKPTSHRKQSSDEARRSKASEPKANPARTRTAAAKPEASHLKPKKRRDHGFSISSQHTSHQKSRAQSKKASASISGLYSDHTTTKVAPRRKRRDPDILSSDTYRDRLPGKTKSQKKRNDPKRVPRSKPSKKIAASRRGPSSRHDSSFDYIETPPKDNKPRIECLVCTEPKTARHFPTCAPTSSCTHDAQTCTRCLRQWITSEFEGKVWDQIDCPECRERMQYEDMKQFAPSSIFRKYDRLSTKAALEAIPGFHWCPSKNCTSGQVHDSGYESPKFECIACQRRYCVVHNRRWHEGETCAEFDYRTDGTQKMEEERASERLIQETAKKCPGCKGNVEKMSGCDHMTCSKCRHQFCWICLAPYGPIREEGNNMHTETCRYYSV
ncbi:uncharacterized protein BDZ99DRAFT_189117 [Mytilinidion resinicola]|uniref:RBR-type E3 ubiquitin transferase n=1 Tax=Mytilinidion resinicola TaxID=574789 RepID=A0A6A6Z1I8_9PEZI|nr:uncharacterized protein BDZ99DRAFT_189117 [Mytilinidion resinicola]KAF2815032.1 hypothetical protein BDZ99DRAFT_189117 [Mytilinidion resinicola]